MASARTLAKTLHGERTQVSFSAKQSSVKVVKGIHL